MKMKQVLPRVMVVKRFSVKFESTSSLLSTTSEIETAWFPVVSRIGTRRDVTVAVTVPVVIDIVTIVRMTEGYLTRAIAVRVRGYRRTRVRMRVAEAVTVGRCRCMIVRIIRIYRRINGLAVVSRGRWYVVIILSAVSMNRCVSAIFYLYE